MPTLAAARVANAAFRPAYGRPVAVVVGGTGGIGAAITQTLARHLNGDLDVVLVGRSASGARAVLDSLPSPSAPQSTTPRLPTRSFVECDATRMRDVARAAHEIRGMLPRVNFLVLTPGVLSLGGRDETDEGIDRKLALHYYARWKFIHELMPLLQAARDAGQDARVMTVLHAGGGGKVDLSDLGLKRTFTLSSAASAGSSYNDCMVESLAERHPDMAFIHAFPGAVHTSAGRGSPSRVLRAAAPLLGLLYRVAGTPPDVCGEHLVAALLAHARGAALVDERGDPVAARPDITDAETRAQLWAHTLEATRTPQSGVV